MDNMIDLEIMYNHLNEIIKRRGRAIRISKSRIKNLADEQLSENLFDTMISEVENLRKNYNELNSLIERKLELEDMIENTSKEESQ